MEIEIKAKSTASAALEIEIKGKSMDLGGREGNLLIGLQLRGRMRSRQGAGDAPSWMSALPPPEVRALELGHRRLGAAPGHAAAQGARIGRTEVAGC